MGSTRKPRNKSPGQQLILPQRYTQQLKLIDGQEAWMASHSLLAKSKKSQWLELNLSRSAKKSARFLWDQTGCMSPRSSQQFYLNVRLMARSPCLPFSMAL